MTAQEERTQRIGIINSIILKAQRDFRQICVTLKDNSKYVMDPMILIDYVDNDDFKLSPMVMEWGQTPQSAYLEDVYSVNAVLGSKVSPDNNDNGKLELYSDIELVKSIAGVQNAIVSGRIRF